MVHEIWFASLLSVVIVSLISLVGVFTLGIKTDRLRKFLIYLISFSAGTLLGDAFLHLLPEVIEASGFTVRVALYVLLGITVFFVLEKFIHWKHCHGNVTEDDHIHPFAYMNLVGDGVHNFLDGIIIAVSYLVSVPAGIATTVAVLLHEIPQEIGDFGVLLQGGFSKRKALLVNFISALFAILGAALALWLGKFIEGIELVLVPIAVGGFIYIAASDLIPQLHKDSENFWRSVLQLLAFVAGVGVMVLLLLLE